MNSGGAKIIASRSSRGIQGCLSAPFHKWRINRISPQLVRRPLASTVSLPVSLGEREDADPRKRLKNRTFGTNRPQIFQGQFHFVSCALPLSCIRALVSVIALLALVGCNKPGEDSDTPYPRKPIKVIVPFSAGGGSDGFVRIIQKAVKDEGLLPHPFVVINVPGAGGAIGSRRVRNATPDGYTILCLHEGILTSKYSGRTPYGPEAFRAIAATGQSSLVICVREDSPFNTLTELMEAATLQPDEIRFGMAHGTPTQFVGRKLESSATNGTLRFRYVASGGGAKRFNDLIGTHIDVTPFSLAEYSKFQASGIRALAFLGESRLAELPTIPTAREQGFDVVMQNIQYWWAPKSTLDAAIEKIAQVLEAALTTEFVRERFEELKIQPTFLRDEALETHLVSRDKSFQGVALVKYENLPNLVPIVVILIVLFGVLSFWKSPLAGPKARQETNARLWARPAGTLGVMSAYVLAMQFINLSYITATAAFVPLMALAIGACSKRDLMALVAIGVALGVGCFVLFTKLLVIDLP